MAFVGKQIIRRRIVETKESLSVVVAKNLTILKRVVGQSKTRTLIRASPGHKQIFQIASKGKITYFMHANKQNPATVEGGLLTVVAQTI